MKRAKTVKVPPGHEGHERLEAAADVLSNFVLKLAQTYEVCPICLTDYFHFIVSEAEKDGKITHGRVIDPDEDGGTDLFATIIKETMQ